MRQEQTVSPLTPGAGRFIDTIWPSPNNYVLNAPMMLRNVASATARLPTFVVFGTGALSGVGYRNGVPVYAVQSASPGNGNAVVLIDSPVLPYTSRGAIDGRVNDLQCWRIIWRAAMFAAPIAGAESGLYLTTDTAHTRIVTDSNFGFGFRFLSDGSLNFVSVTGGAATTTLLLAAASGYDLTATRTYELRIFGATPIADASLQILLDGTDLTGALPVTQRSWAAGTVLPTMANALTGPGLLPSAVNNAGNVNAVYVTTLRVIAGPTVAALF